MLLVTGTLGGALRKGLQEGWTKQGETDGVARLEAWNTNGRQRRDVFLKEIYQALAEITVSWKPRRFSKGDTCL